MNVDQVINKLIVEKQNNLASRFPCRAIMVRNIKDYCDLLEKLRSIPGIEFVTSDALFSGVDVLPRYENITSSEYRSKWYVLPGVSEYLRLFCNNEATTRRFTKLWKYQAPSSSVSRIIIPLWGCQSQWFDKALHFTDDIRQQDYFFNCTDTYDTDQRMRLIVLAESLKDNMGCFNTKTDQKIDRLKAWYEYWSNPDPDVTDFTLITARINAIQPSDGNITVQVMRNKLSFIKSVLAGGKKLSEDICPEEAQDCLLEYSSRDQSVEQAILSSLNIKAFQATDVMSRWEILSIGQKQLVRLWYYLNPDESYLSQCFHNTKSQTHVEEFILHFFFKMRDQHPEWVTESQKLISVMRLKRDDKYYEELDSITHYPDRLALLSGASQRERYYLLHMVGIWLKEDTKKFYENKEIRQIYPALAAYLDGVFYDEELRRYMKLYKMHKLANTLPEDEQLYFANIRTDSYDNRYTILADYITDQSTVLWIDALGIEWMPLLLWSLDNNESFTISAAAVGKANLPSETEFNREWEKMNVPYHKLDKLDKLAHKGVIDDSNYYSCVEEQIQFIAGLKEKVLSLLKQYHRVVITGDHGSSRLAARFFHKREGIPLEAEGKAYNHGRYALVNNENGHISDTQISENDGSGNRFIMFRNYDHFVKSGFATGTDDNSPIYGELHGGATPEEMLVPIIVGDSKEEIPLIANWKQDTVKIAMKKAKATILFNQPVHQIDVKIGNHSASSVPLNGNKEWIITFSSIKEGAYDITLIADGRIVAIDKLRVLSALGNPEGDLLW